MAAQRLKTAVSPKHVFPVAGVGASAGGLDAFKKLVKAIPASSGIAWVLIQHQQRNHESKLVLLLQKIAAVPVSLIGNNIQIKPNNIYVVPPNNLLSVKDGKFKLAQRPVDKTQPSYPINSFFESLAQIYQENAIGIILSGTGVDGTRGLKAIKDHGGITLCQTIATAAYNDMPQSAIAAGVVDFKLAPEKMPKKLAAIKKVISADEGGAVSIEGDDDSFKEILSLLHVHKGMDFTFYKQTTIRRRILRRMILNKSKTITDYITYLKKNNTEINGLYQDMLIPVTSFFRDEKTFSNLCDGVFPNLVKNKQADGIIRIWVAGCSTGEEAYSIAICFKEYLGDKDEKVQIFATDLSQPAIAKARAGIYSKADAEAVSHHRIKKFFTPVKGGYQVNKDLRDMCVFAVHNFLKDPPFGKIDFISCRNVLIYMDSYLQKKALATFHYALNPKGLLILGKSENTIGITDLFVSNNKAEKIFTRKNVPSRQMPITSKRVDLVSTSEIIVKPPETKRTDFHKLADDLVLANYSPPAVVVNEAMDIVHFRGNTAIYLQQSQGKPTHNLLKMAKPGLAFELRNIIHKTIRKKAHVKKENIPFQVANVQRLITLEAMPLPGMADPHFLLVFNDSVKVINKKTSGSAAGSKKDEDVLRIQQMEHELAQLREDMRTITEDQEASNEELQSSNEELQSSNEELQSLNEELETSKEELQSTVEELTVVNQEMVNLNEQLNVEKDYAEAIIATIPSPMLVLDKDLRVIIANQLFYEKFLVNEVQTEGKLVYEIGNKQWDIANLRTLLENTLAEKTVLFGYEVEHNFQNIGRKIMRLNARKILREKGEKQILLIIEDVTDIVQAARKIEESEHRFHSMIYSSPFMIAILEGKDLVIKNANDAILKTWGKGKEVIGMPIKEAIPESVERGSFEKLEKVYKTGEPFYGYEIPIPITNDGHTETRYYTFIYQPQKNINGHIEGVAILASEVTPYALLTKKIKESDEKFQAAVQAVEGVVWTNNAIGEMEGEQTGWANLTGQTFEEYQGYGWSKAVHPDDAAGSVASWQQAVNTRTTYVFEHRVKVKDGSWRLFAIKAIPLKNEDGSIKSWVGVHTDITEKRRAEMQIIESEEKFRTMAESSDILIGVNNESVNAVYFNKAWEKLTGRPVEEMLNLGWLDLLHPDDREPFMNKFLDAFNKKEPYEGEFRILNKDGGYSWLYTKVGVRLHPDGSYAGHISSSIDITERKLNEKALQDSELKLRSVIENSPFPIAVYVGKELLIEFANQSIIDIYGKGNDVIGKSYRKILPELANQKIFEQIDEVMETGVPFHAKNQRVDIVVDGKLQPYYFNYSFTPLYNVAGEIYAVINTGAEVTDIVLAKQKVEESQEQFSTLAENMENLAWLADGHGEIYWYNRRWLDYTGLTLEEMKGWGWQKVHHPDHVDRILEISKKLWVTNEPFELTFPLRRYDGEYRWFLTRGYPLTDEQGKIIRWLGTNTDITKQIETQQQLSLLSTIVDSSGDAIISKTLESIITSWNKGAEQIFGYTANEVVGKPIFILIPEELHQEEDMVISKIKEGGSVQQYETIRQTKDGRRINISLTVSPIKDKEGNVIGASKIARDITDQVIARKKIEESEANFKLLSEEVPQKIVNADAAGSVFYYNKNWIDYTGLTHEDLYGDGWAQTIHPDDLEKLATGWVNSVQTGNVFEMEHRIKNKYGEYFWHINRAVPVKNDKGEITKWIGAATEIQKIKEEEQRKGDFIKMVSHELKTPVTSIKGYVQMLMSMLNEKEEIDTKGIPVKSSLSRMDEQIKRLTRLITEMLDLGKLEESKLRLKKEKLLLNDLIKETINDIEFTSKTHHINVQEPFKAWVVADKDRIQQVIINLVNNAIKYSPQKQHVNVVIDQKSEGTVEVSIQDFGIGINQSEHEKIFGRFYQIDGREGFTFTGFGIGLYIAKEILVQHNGSIGVTSEPGKGSMFTFTLPLAQ